MAFSDEWLVPTLSTLVSEEQIAKMRREARDATSLWEALVDRRDGRFLEIEHPASLRWGLCMQRNSCQHRP